MCDGLRCKHVVAVSDYDSIAVVVNDVVRIGKGDSKCYVRY